MVYTKTSLNKLSFDFGEELTNAPVIEFPLYVHLDALPHEPPTDWSMKPNGQLHLRWIDPIIPPSLEGLEGTPFVPYDFEASSL